MEIGRTRHTTTISSTGDTGHNRLNVGFASYVPTAGMNIFVAFFVLLLLLADSTPPAASSIPLIGTTPTPPTLRTPPSRWRHVTASREWKPGRQRGPLHPGLTLQVFLLLRAQCEILTTEIRTMVEHQVQVFASVSFLRVNPNHFAKRKVSNCLSTKTPSGSQVFSSKVSVDQSFAAVHEAPRAKSLPVVVFVR